MTKEKTALVIPNAIQVCTESSEKHFFCSFGARDKTYVVLFRTWQQALLDQVKLEIPEVQSLFSSNRPSALETVCVARWAGVRGAYLFYFILFLSLLTQTDNIRFSRLVGGYEVLYIF